VTHWRNLAHRTAADPEATGMHLRLDTTARRIDVRARKLLVTAADSTEDLLADDKRIVGTGALPVRPLTDDGCGHGPGQHRRPPDTGLATAAGASTSRRPGCGPGSPLAAPGGPGMRPG
jgi:NADPH-dependent 2,4-dienoyl-CoA reductase/sulfur reductase-like enzyme